MRKLFKKHVLPYLLIVAMITNVIAPELTQPSVVYAAEEQPENAETGKTAGVSLKNGGIEIDGQFYTDAELKTLLENSKIVRIPFDAETGRSMIEQAIVSGRVINTASLAALGIAVAGVFIMLAVRLALTSLKDNAYQVITGNGKTYDFRFLGDALFINNTYINAFTSTIAVITSFFDNHLTANPDEEVVVPDTGSGDVTKPGEGTEGDSESGDVTKPDESTEGDSDTSINSKDINWNIDDNLKHHIANGSNGNHREPWKNFGIDPDDPNFYLLVLPYLKKVIDEGEKLKETVVQDGTILLYIKNFAEKGQEIIVKIFVNNKDNIKRLSDAYINTR